MLQVPSDVQALFSLSQLPTSPKHNATFHALLQTLDEFVKDPTGESTLPLTSTLPDMKSDTESYVKLQNNDTPNTSWTFMKMGWLLHVVCTPFMPDFAETLAIG